MTMILRLFPLLLLLAACSGNDARYLIEPPVAAAKSRSFLGSLVVREVSLPAYAAAEEIQRQETDGALREAKGALWADLPVRGVTLALVRQLDELTSATVASEPWPFGGLSDAVLDVRVEQIFAASDGQFHLTGQYFVAGDAIDLRPISASFDITVPMAGNEPADIVAAQSEAISLLARQIAARIAR